MTVTECLLAGVVVALLFIGAQLGRVARAATRLASAIEEDIAPALDVMRENLSEIQAGFPRPIDRAIDQIRREAAERAARPSR
jgi:hypothetical protein